MELLKKLYKVYSPSGKERTMIKFIWNYTKRITGTKVETDAAGNLYITKGEAESYPCIVAHLDQVQRLHSKDFTTVETGEMCDSIRLNKSVGLYDGAYKVVEIAMGLKEKNK